MNPSSLVWASASAGHLDSWAVLPTLTHRVLVRLLPGQHRRAPLRVERGVLAGGAGEVPGVLEDVAGEELRDGLRQRHLADVRVAQHPPGGGRVLERAPAPRRTGARQAPAGSSSTGRPGGSSIPAPVGEERREPLDEVAHDVARRPLRRPATGRPTGPGGPPATTSPNRPATSRNSWAGVSLMAGSTRSLGRTHRLVPAGRRIDGHEPPHQAVGRAARAGSAGPPRPGSP